jgi:hypothetical protein
MTAVMAPEAPLAQEAPAKVPAWVYRLDVDPPARHEAWRRAIRILHVRRSPGVRRRRTR